MFLTLNTPFTTEVVCWSRLLKCLRSLHGKQCGPRSDCSYRSSVFWVHAACFYTWFASNIRQLFAADDFSGRLFQNAIFFLGALRANVCLIVSPFFHPIGACLTLKAPPIICSRRQLNNFATFSKITNKALYFMRIVCQQTILMKYNTLFLLKIEKDVSKCVVCCSCD